MHGLIVPKGCNFVIDWGYKTTQGAFPVDLAINCLYVRALQVRMHPAALAQSCTQRPSRSLVPSGARAVLSNLVRALNIGRLVYRQASV